MVDVDSVLMSVQERDKWRHRMELLERSLREVREKRHRIEARLHRVKKEITRLRRTLEAVRDLTRPPLPAEVTRASRSPPSLR